MKSKPDVRWSDRKVLVALALLCNLGLGACERPMTIAVTKDTNPPSFKLSGSGRLVFLTVSEVIPGKTPSVDDPVMWKIEPAEERLISHLPEVTYGSVPPGFTQTAPAHGMPQPLLEGKIYEIGGPAYDADGGAIRFTIENGKAVVLSSAR